MRINDRYSVGSTSGNRRYPGNRITVYRDGIKMLTVSFPVREPLAYIRRCNTGKHKETFYYACLNAGIPDEVIMQMINGP